MSPAAASHPAQRKARGAFFTPAQIAEFIARWAVRDAADAVLEPSCGEAAFLMPAGARLLELGAARGRLSHQLHGCDIHADSVEVAGRELQQQGMTAALRVGDFFEQPADARFDAVIGNPPYVRYQSFAGTARGAALRAALQQGVRLTQLASSWAAFTVHAAAFLKPGGRLGLVLPAELLSVKYAAQVRSFLLRRFGAVRLVLFESLVFPGVLEDVVLLLAEDNAVCGSHFEVCRARDAADLCRLVPDRWIGFTPRGSDKWISALLPARAMTLYEAAVRDHRFEWMLDWGDTYLGAVTGNNGFFTLDRQQVRALGLPESELLPISPPGSRHLQGLAFTADDWASLADQGARCYLFRPANGGLSSAAAGYIDRGKRQRVHQAYKCRMREPWWRVPLAPRPDLLFTYMSHDRPRLLANRAGVQLLNSVYGVRLHAARRSIGEELLPLASLNSLTLLGAELLGRGYGGGMLKHEPTEVDALPVPSIALVEALAGRLRPLLEPVGTFLQSGEVGPAIEAVDAIILADGLRLTHSEIGSLRAARAVLVDRRMTRAKGGHGPN